MPRFAFAFTFVALILGVTPAQIAARPFFDETTVQHLSNLSTPLFEAKPDTLGTLDREEGRRRRRGVGMPDGVLVSFDEVGHAGSCSRSRRS